MKFEEKHFKRFDFTNKEIRLFLENSRRDLDIAKNNKTPEVIFRFGYDSILKSCIALIAFCGFKAKSVPGHHIIIISKASEILNHEYAEIFYFCNNIRRKRNFDLYAGGSFFSVQEAKNLIEISEKIYTIVKNYVQKGR
ncbi:MAG: hypothetical protein UT33_C0009G0057 [Candidatus Peregrinibacteria bacterium GW2011_GWC2_39_14]|nr:MAG: hypothetical protein US92_C0005G0057 [Candidatus Peregrinibacteria bacterium GW2011_GWA2_38_36]KKR06606.1 MAG: hypothetical protein UT33_C0009G0057 [Candidatus Peregrinibacteria bacterium GW2011_GWC2_39_14]